MPFGDPRFGKLIRCECQERRDLDRFQQQIGRPLPPVTLDDLIPRGEGSRQMIRAAQAFIAQPAGMLTLLGRNGTGKTTCAQAIANALRDSGRAVLYITAYDMLAYVKAGIGMDFNADDRLRKLAGIPVLLIDELAQVNLTGYVAEKIEWLVDRRYSDRAPTVLVMDMRPDEVLHPRLVSRIRSGVVVWNNDMDMRPLLGEVYGD